MDAESYKRTLNVYDAEISETERIIHNLRNEIAEVEEARENAKGKRSDFDRFVARKKAEEQKTDKYNQLKKGAKNMTSTQIKLQIANCELQIKKNCNAIRKAENDYESLTGFKQNVITCQSNFSAGNSGKIQALESVSPITHNCNAALRYYKGMKKLVNSSGGKIINVLLERLIVSAQDSMRGYLKKISDLENENDHLRRKIEQLQQELKIAEMNDVLADANK